MLRFLGYMDYDRLLTARTDPVSSGRTPVTDPPESGRGTLVAVVEDHEILRHGLVACLIREPGIEVTVPSGDEPLAEHVDIAVVSSQAASRKRFPCPIVVCSDDPDGPRNVAEGNNVVGLVHRESVTVPQLHATIRAAAAGLRVRPNVESTKHDAELDPRSLRLVELIAEGHSTREIADDMSYSEQTIKKLITTVEGRLEARSRAHMVAVAIRRGLI
jgi:DNA-binding NarL/FixJ family response regulator